MTATFCCFLSVLSIQNAGNICTKYHLPDPTKSLYVVPPQRLKITRSHKLPSNFCIYMGGPKGEQLLVFLILFNLAIKKQQQQLFLSELTICWHCSKIHSHIHILCTTIPWK